MTKPLIICGLHRSGTTFVGKILQQADVVVVHEPLNEDFGMQGILVAYPFVEGKKDKYSTLIDDALNMKRAWNKDTTYIKAKGFRRILYQLLGGRSGVRWEALRLRKALGILPEKLCFKDPFMSLATPYLVQQHDVKVLCMVRHPAAIHSSTEKQDWRFDIQNLRKQSNLIDQYAADISDKHWDMAEEYAAASIAILWKLMIRINFQLAKQAPNNVLLLTHEDLCLDAQKSTNKIFKHFNLPVSNFVQTFVTEHSEGSQAESKLGKVHDFQRDSKALVNVWKKHINAKDKKMIFEIAADELVRIYGK